MSKKFRLDPDYDHSTGSMNWIWAPLVQTGIDVRQSGHHREMHYYLMLLREEVGMTRKFLAEDIPARKKISRRSAGRKRKRHV